jgi:hypothetical protein
MSNVLMAQGRFGEAAGALQAAPGDDWAPYARFNLGVALVRSGASAEGRRLLESVGTMPATTEEELSLRDRANLALGFALLQERAGEPAVAALTRVRLDGPFTNRALLGLGWAELDVQRPERALVPWFALRERNLLDSAVQESFLAVPYAFAQLASNGQAAQQYGRAVTAYADEAARIDESIAAIGRGGFLDSILEATPGNEFAGWFWQLRNVGDAPHTRYLYHLLASHEFQEGLKNYRDLRIMQRNLERSRESLAAFDDMVDARRQAARQRAPSKARMLASLDLDDLTRRQADVAARLAAIESRRDVAALAEGAEAKQWTELDRVEAALAAIPAGPQREALAERARLLRGMLVWQLDAAYKVRLRGVKRSLAEAAASLDEARRRVAGIAVRELEAQKRRLASYAMQAQFALAALYDGAASGGTP